MKFSLHEEHWVSDPVQVSQEALQGRQLSAVISYL